MTLASPEYQKMNGQVKVMWKTLRTIVHSLMVHAIVSEAYVHFALIYMTDQIFLVLPTKFLIKKDGNTTTQFKLATCKKHSVSHLLVLFCPFVVTKATAHVGKKATNICHQVQKGFHCIFVGIP